MNYKELNIEWNNPEESTDLDELSICTKFHNDFSHKEEYNACLELIVEDKCYKGSDKEFEEILSWFPNHSFTEIQNVYTGSLDQKIEEYFRLEYQGLWISKFDMVNIKLTGSKEQLELIKQHYNLID